MVPTKQNTTENIFPEVQPYGDVNLFVNLDDGTTNNNTDSVSNYTKAIYDSLLTSVVNLERVSYKGYSELYNVTTSQKVKLNVSSEQFDLSINKLTFARYHDDKIDKITPKISTTINDVVYPKNYISNQKSNSAVKFSYYSGSCGSTLLSYYDKIFISCQKITKSYFFNYCLDSDGKLVVFNLIDSVNNDITSKIEIGDYKSYKYKDIFVTSSIQKNLNETESSMLFLIDSSNNIYFFSITENTCSSSNDVPTLKYLNTIQINKNSNIVQLGYNDNYIFVASNSSFTRYLRTNVNQGTSLDSIKIKDFIVLEKKIWIISDSGLVIMDITNLNKDKTYSHPYMLKFDFFFNAINNKNSTRFIGILIDQDITKNIPEVLIEFIANSQYESTPLLNKVYYNSKKTYKMDKYSMLNITASDIEYFYTYLLDLDDYKLIIIPRTVLFYQKSLIYKYSVYNFKMLSNIDTIKLNILNSGKFEIIPDEDNIYPYLNIIFNGINSYVFFHSEPNSPEIKVKFTKEARYRIFTYQHQDCSYYDNNEKYVLKECDYITGFKLQVNIKKNSVFYWLLGVIVFIVIVLIFIFICCLLKRRANRKKRYDTEIGEVRKNEMIPPESARGTDKEKN